MKRKYEQQEQGEQNPSKNNKKTIYQSITDKKLEPKTLDSIPEYLQCEKLLTNFFNKTIRKNTPSGYKIEIICPKDIKESLIKVYEWETLHSTGDIAFVFNPESKCWKAFVLGNHREIIAKEIPPSSTLEIKLQEIINSENISSSSKDELKKILESNPLFEGYHSSTSINGLLTNGETPLHYAIRRGETRYIEILLSNGADVNQADKWGFLPLNIAVMTNLYTTVPIIKLLLKKGAKIKKEVPPDATFKPETAIHLIFKKIPYTLNELRNKTEKDESEITLLKTIKLEILECFFEHLQNKININEQDHYGRTLLHHAILGTNLQKMEIIEFLISKGASKAIKDKFGETPEELQARLVKENKFYIPDSDEEYANDHGTISVVITPQAKTPTKQVFFNKNGEMIVKDIYTNNRHIVADANTAANSQLVQMLVDTSSGTPSTNVSSTTR